MYIESITVAQVILLGKKMAPPRWRGTKKLTESNLDGKIKLKVNRIFAGIPSQQEPLIDRQENRHFEFLNKAMSNVF